MGIGFNLFVSLQAKGFHEEILLLQLEVDLLVLPLLLLLIVCLCTLVTYTPTLLYFVIIANRCTIDWKWFFFVNPLISTYLPSYMFAFALIVVFLRGKHLVGKHVTAKHATGKHLTGSVDCWQALKLVSMWALRRFLASFPITCFLVAYFMITCFPIACFPSTFFTFSLTKLNMASVFELIHQRNIIVAACFRAIALEQINFCLKYEQILRLNAKNRFLFFCFVGRV